MSHHEHHPASETESPSDHEHENENEDAEEGEGEEDEQGHAPKKKGARFPFAHRSAGASAKSKRETRIGIAALVSFLILVTVLIMNKGSKRGLPLASIPGESAPKEPESKAPVPPSKGTAESKAVAPDLADKSNDTSGPLGNTPLAEKDVQTASAEKVVTPTPSPDQGTMTPPPPNTATTADLETRSEKPGEPVRDVTVPSPAPVTAPDNEPLINTLIPQPAPELTANAPQEKEQGLQVPASAPNPDPVGLGQQDTTTPPVGGASLPPATELPPVEQAPLTPGPAPTPSLSPAPAQEELQPATPQPQSVTPTEIPNFTAAPPASAPVTDVPSTETISFAPIKPGEGDPIPNAGKGRGLDDEPLEEAATVAAGAVAGQKGGSARPVDEDRVEPVPHVVRSGENFYTIAKDHYGSDRYYVALWKANSRLVPAIDKLRVGTTIRIPAPEDLDRSLIEPARVSRPSTSSARTGTPVKRTSSSSRRASGAEIELALPVSDVLLSQEARRKPAADDDPAPDIQYRSTRRTYKVRAGETLRSIARDTLNSPRRENEIYDLNRNVIDNPKARLVEGQLLELPDDARPVRRPR